MYNHVKLAYQTADGMARKTQQVVMLYEGMIRFTQQAHEAIEHRDPEARYNMIAKTCDIITGLHLSLNREQGGQIAMLLDEFYSSLTVRLRSVQRSKDLVMLESCIANLKTMRDAWIEVDREHAESSASDITDAAIYKSAILQDALGLRMSGMEALQAISVSV